MANKKKKKKEEKIPGLNYLSMLKGIGSLKSGGKKSSQHW